ncbi:MAG: VOC family protein [Myxococcales bacterium]|nr:VOC family protein [Myxococcales bacterium]
MKPVPKGWPRMSASVYYDDPRAAIDWLCKAFGFETRMVVEGDDGSIVHSELMFDEGLVMVGSVGKNNESDAFTPISPKSLEGRVTGSLCLFVDDCDAHHKVAVEHGAKIVREPTTNDYGDDYWTDRSYGALDPEGHLWWFMQRIKGG